jgi:site-specific recombinase XerD
MHHRSISDPKGITPRVWFAYVEDRLKANIKPASLNTSLRTLQSFLKYLHDEGIPSCERMLEIRPLKTTDALPAT